MRQNLPSNSHSEGSDHRGYGPAASGVVYGMTDPSSTSLDVGATIPPPNEETSAAPFSPELFSWVWQLLHLTQNTSPQNLSPSPVPSAPAGPPAPTTVASYEPRPSGVGPARSTRKRACDNCQGPLSSRDAASVGGNPPSTSTVTPQVNSRRPKAESAEVAKFFDLLKKQSWYNKGPEFGPEPPILANDIFVREGFCEEGDSSRFLWLTLHNNGRFLCRIPHNQARNQARPCAHEVLKPKDAIAHVYEYFKYKPYFCQGNGHENCGKWFFTLERERDHGYKKKASPELRVPCTQPGCHVTMLTRNLARHLETQHDVT